MAAAAAVVPDATHLIKEATEVMPAGHKVRKEQIGHLDWVEAMAASWAWVEQPVMDVLHL